MARTIAPLNNLSVIYDPVVARQLLGHNEHITRPNNFNVGEQYALRGSECDDFKATEKVYECHGFISSYKNIPLNCAIMKQIGGTESTIYQLTKNDCKSLGIEYQDRLQLFPTTLPWTNITPKEEKEFNSNDLSTYPTNDADEITGFIVKLSGFRPYQETHVIDTSNKLIDSYAFANSLNCQVYYMDIRPIIVTANYTEGRHAVCDEEGNIYLKVMTGNLPMNLLKNMTIGRLMTISWETPETSRHRADNDNTGHHYSARYPDRELSLRNNINDFAKGRWSLTEPSEIEEGMYRTDGTTLEVFHHGRWQRYF